MQIQERRKEIGRQGEEFVVDYERKKLVEAGNLELATRVKRISIDDIGAGYDVLSFTTTGEEKHIEVKTTIGTGYSFEITINEINKSKNLPNYFIYEDPELSKQIAPMWDHPNLKGVETHGGSYWIRIGA